MCGIVSTMCSCISLPFEVGFDAVWKHYVAHLERVLQSLPCGVQVIHHALFHWRYTGLCCRV